MANADPKADVAQPFRNDPAFVDFFFGYAEYAGKRAAAVLYDVARELRKRPVVQEVVAKTASELDSLFFVELEWPDIQKRGQHPEDEFRYLLAEMPEARRREAGVIEAELVAERARIDAVWNRLGVLGDDIEEEEQRELMRQAEGDTVELQHRALQAIVEGTVDPASVAAAALGTHSLGNAEKFLGEDG